MVTINPHTTWQPHYARNTRLSCGNDNDVPLFLMTDNNFVDEILHGSWHRRCHASRLTAATASRTAPSTFFSRILRKVDDGLVVAGQTLGSHFTTLFLNHFPVTFFVLFPSFTRYNNVFPRSYSCVVNYSCRSAVGNGTWYWLHVDDCSECCNDRRACTTCFRYFL